MAASGSKGSGEEPGEHKVSLKPPARDGQFTMLVEAPRGARIELVLDEDGRLVSVRRAAAR